MGLFKISLILLLGLLYCTHVFGQFGGGRGGGRGGGFGGGRVGGRGGGRGGGFGAGISAGRGGIGGSIGSRRYRSALYNDDDVYGYEATYPGGEAMYVNYRTSEARAKRAQEFARSSPYSSGGSQGSSGYEDQGGMEKFSNFEPQW